MISIELAAMISEPFELIVVALIGYMYMHRIRMLGTVGASALRNYRSIS
jgi:hypothetical protein